MKKSTISYDDLRLLPRSLILPNEWQDENGEGACLGLYRKWGRILTIIWIE